MEERAGNLNVRQAAPLPAQQDPNTLVYAHETEISGHIAGLSTMIEKLDGAAVQTKDIVVISLLLCYIKRLSNLFFHEQEADTISPDELMVYLDELADIAVHADVKILLSGEVKEPISVRKARLLYDYFYNAVDWAANGHCPNIIAHLNMKEGGGGIEMRLLPSADARTFTPDTELSSAIAAEGGSFTLTDYDDAFGFYLSFPVGGEEEQLQEQENRLKLRGEELKDTIDNLHILSREKELQNIQMHAHDILGGWLTMLLYAIRSEQVPDLDTLRLQSRSLTRDLIEGREAASPQDKFDSLKKSFETIGVEILLDGELPGDKVKGHLLMDVIGEGVVNAVRHGFATEVSVLIRRSDGGWHLEVTDNGQQDKRGRTLCLNPLQTQGTSPFVSQGTSPFVSRPIAEGGGLGGLRKKLELHGGTLNIAAEQRFVLAVDLPGGEEDG